jgi:hypothetical protein
MNFGRRRGVVADMTQFVASSFGEVGVQGQYLDGELHLVDDSLAGAVPTGEKLEIDESVIGSDSIDVMDCFFGTESSPDTLFHDVTVFENIPGRFCADSRNHGANVAPTPFVSSDLLIRVVFPVRQPSEKRATLGTAQRFQSVDCASRSPLNGHSGSALNACGGPLFVRKTSADTAAPRGAVHRVFVPFFAVLAQGCRLIAEWLFAHTAFEHGEFGLRGRATISSFIRSFAGSTTKALAGVRRLDLKKGLALFTAFFDGHLVFSAVGVCSNDCGVARMFVSVNRRFERCHSPA